MEFKEFMRLVEFVDTHGMALLLPSLTWKEPDLSAVPGDRPSLTSLGLPTVRTSGRIDLVIKDKNPIYVQLSDGTKLFLTHDEFRRIPVIPEVGKTMTVVFQRKDGNNSPTPSVVQHCSVT